jgi:two-component system, OmpR family, phosphate regulon sensor histidine kinase PhoR
MKALQTPTYSSLSATQSRSVGSGEADGPIRTDTHPGGQSEMISVETGEVAAAKAPAQFYCAALGSCVAVFIYDLKHQLGGVAHVMLPSTDLYTHGDDPLKYADVAIDTLVSELLKRGADKNRLQAKIVGGALILEDETDIGKANIQAILQKLAGGNIPVTERHVGGRKSMHATFDTTTGDMIYKDNEAPLIPLRKKFEDFVRPDFAINVTQAQKAYLNILEDMQADKEGAEKQRIATLNVLEDVTESQDQLKEIYRELHVEKELIHNMGYSLKVTDILKQLIEAMSQILPKPTYFAYSMPFSDPDRPSKLMYIHASGALGKDYLQSIKKSIQMACDTMPTSIQQGKGVKAWAQGDFLFEFIEGTQDDTQKIKPLSSFNVPLFIQGELLGMMNISSEVKNMFTAAHIKLVNNMVNTAASTIMRLRHLLQAEESGVQSLVESLSNGVVMFDLERRVSMTNPAIEKMTGLPPKGFYLSELSKLFTSAAAAAAAAAAADKALLADFDKKIDQTLLTGEVTHIEEVNISRFSYEVFISPIRNHEKKIMGGAIVLHDITHVKEIDRMKTEFVSIASHQLKTPLTSIKWYTEMLMKEDRNLTPEQRDILQQSYESSQRMSRLINALLNVSRLDTGQIKVEPKPVYLEDFITQCISGMQGMIEKYKGEIEFRKPDQPFSKIPIDSALLGHVLQNLMTNAILYTPEDRKCLVIIQLSQKDDDFIISIKDNGIGIDKKVQSRIFDKFFRADNARLQDTTGSGLGLYIIKAILEASGGTIRFESKEGEGTVFFVTFPMKGMQASQGLKGLA